MYAAARSILFRLDPETAHGVTLIALDMAHRLGLSGQLGGGARVDDPIELMGLRFPNRVGLAAGLDKNADHLDALGTHCIQLGACGSNMSQCIDVLCIQ